MRILQTEQRDELLKFLPGIKQSLKEWLFIDVRLADPVSKDFGITDAANMLCLQFDAKEGILYICNSHEILMLLRWGASATNTTKLAREISDYMPKGSCEVNVREPTPEGLTKLEMLIVQKSPTTHNFAALRAERAENVILVADDDMYMRMLVKKGAGANYIIVEVDDGDKALEIYKKVAPDILFLDIHMPKMDGIHVLQEVLAIDPKAYVVMLSADSSMENVSSVMMQGAVGFMTKPFNKEKLSEYIRKCPSIV